MHICVVMQNYGKLGQLSLALLFTCDSSLQRKSAYIIGPCNCHLVWHVVNQQYIFSIPENSAHYLVS